MPLQVAIQMDPIERVNIESDTTFLLMLEAQTRGHGLFIYAADKLALASRMPPGIMTCRLSTIPSGRKTLAPPMPRIPSGSWSVMPTMRNLHSRGTTEYAAKTSRS